MIRTTLLASFWSLSFTPIHGNNLLLLFSVRVTRGTFGRQLGVEAAHDKIQTLK